MGITVKNISELVALGLQHQASDIHLRQGEGPVLRIRGELIPVKSREFTEDDMLDMAKIFFPSQKMVDDIANIKEWDGGYTLPDVCRLRINFFRFLDKIGLVLRLIKTQVPTLESLNLPPILAKFCKQERGLILVTGATGSGKSTTLASLVNHINQNRHAHIITIEDPIEYVHTQIKSRISQREIGKDTESFASALRAALRQDPDIILIGEMRDPETVSIALKASETGHLVLSTLHTTNTVATIGRIISMFPPEEQPEIRKRLAENLHATIGQRMLKRADNKGVVLAQEIMATGPGIRDCIMGVEPLSRINEILSKGKLEGGFGTQTFDQHIMDLFESKAISKETALASVSSAADFTQKLEIS